MCLINVYVYREVMIDENLSVFDAQDFIAEVTQHIPLPRVRLVRYKNNCGDHRSG